MSYRLLIHEEAYRELDEAVRYIEARRTGYGIKFREEVVASMRFIIDHPKDHALRRSGFRYGLVRRFPYRVIYKVDGDVIFVAAIYHGKRKPYGWMSRKP